MAKAYWVGVYHSVSNPEALSAYAELAAPAIVAGGGRFLARGNAVKAYEAGLKLRVVIIEFDSVAQAVATHDGEAYQAALKVFGDAGARDLRIVEGVEASSSGDCHGPTAGSRPDNLPAAAFDN
jgi:uncharacterized protein (DUF1330 family)